MFSNDCPMRIQSSIVTHGPFSQSDGGHGDFPPPPDAKFIVKEDGGTQIVSESGNKLITE